MSEFGVVTEPGTVRLERLLPGPVERVWAYLTESEKRATWLAGGPMELKAGGHVELHFRHSELSGEPTPERYKAHDGHRMTGRVLRCDPPRVLSYSWGEGEGRNSEVTFELGPEGDRVRLVVTHRRLPNRKEMVSVAGGWHAHLGILEDQLNGAEPRGFWSTHAGLEAEYEKRISA